MEISVIGTGYVGLTVATCLAESGNDVIGVDIDPQKISSLNKGEIPIYEPGLQELVVSNLSSKRLRFTTNIEEAVENSAVIFVTIGTPEGQAGMPDVSMIEDTIKKIIELIRDYRVIVIKSTVPVGTTRRLKKQFENLTDKEFDLVNNPEFLKEGYAVEDFLRPERIIIGSDSPRASAILEEIYAPFVRNGRPIIVMDPISSEMTKYAANAMLATKISFINEIANLCELTGGDIEAVRKGICSDSRIGYKFLYAGLGFGGSCLPKDMQALKYLSRECEYPAWLLNAVIEVNEYQKKTLQRKIKKYFGEDLRNKIFGIWGLAFKPRTDDIRESPALTLIADLLSSGAKVKVHDPRAMENCKKVFGNSIEYCDNMYDALKEADALCVVTEWNEFRNPHYGKMLAYMKTPIIFDGRNVYNVQKMKQFGFEYFGIGREYDDR